MTALCYFNALRKLGGARRIVEDEVRYRVARYGTQRRLVEPEDAPFTDRSVKEPIELTSRVSTDEVARAKQRLEAVFGRDAEPVDVALAIGGKVKRPFPSLTTSISWCKPSLPIRQTSL